LIRGLTKNRDREVMLVKAATRNGYSITPVSPSRRLMFNCGVVVSASAKSTMVG
jgi:predicted CoA-binding protein